MAVDASAGRFWGGELDGNSKVYEFEVGEFFVEENVAGVEISVDY